MKIKAGSEDQPSEQDSTSMTDEEDIEGDEDVEDEEDIDGEEVVEAEVKAYPGYAGKFHALQNRLNAVKSKLDKMADKGIDSAELQSRYDRVNLLFGQIDSAEAVLNQVQTKSKRRDRKR